MGCRASSSSSASVRPFAAGAAVDWDALVAAGGQALRDAVLWTPVAEAHRRGVWLALSETWPLPGPESPPSAAAVRQIALDVPRTLGGDPGPAEADIGALLTAVASLRPDVGYCQGQNVVAAQLLQYGGLRDVTEATGAFMALLRRFGSLYTPPLARVQAMLALLDEEIAAECPRLGAAVAAAGLSAGAFGGTQWIMTFCAVSWLTRAQAARVLERSLAGDGCGRELMQAIMGHLRRVDAAVDELLPQPPPIEALMALIQAPSHSSPGGGTEEDALVPLTARLCAGLRRAASG